MTLKNSLVPIIAIILLINTALLFFGLKGREGKLAVGGGITDACIATTTSPTIYAFSSGVRSLALGSGYIGGITVTGAGSAGGSIELFDATTTDTALRNSALSSTTQLIASFPSNLAVGDYTVNGLFVYGAQLVIKGTIGTTTIKVCR